MKRILLMVFRNIVLVPFMWIKLCYHARHVEKYTEEEHYKMLQFICHRANKGGNVTIDAHGLENIPDKSGFMFFPLCICFIPFNYIYILTYFFIFIKSNVIFL